MTTPVHIDLMTYDDQIIFSSLYIYLTEHGNDPYIKGSQKRASKFQNTNNRTWMFTHVPLTEASGDMMISFISPDSSAIILYHTLSGVTPVKTMIPMESYFRTGISLPASMSKHTFKNCVSLGNFPPVETITVDPTYEFLDSLRLLPIMVGAVIATI